MAGGSCVARHQLFVLGPALAALTAENLLPLLVAD